MDEGGKDTGGTDIRSKLGPPKSGLLARLQGQKPAEPSQQAPVAPQEEVTNQTWEPKPVEDIPTFIENMTKRYKRPGKIVTSGSGTNRDK